MAAEKKRKKPANKRVQGIDSSLSELTLRDGRELAVVIGKAIQPTPTLTRTIGGASSISLDIRDPELDLLDASLLAENFDAQIDGLWFRYMGASKQGKTITIKLQERGVAELRELKGPKKAFARRGQPNELTRAEFVISLVREAGIPFHCPQLHERRPVKTKAQAKKAKDEARENRGKGLGAVKHLTIDGAPTTPAQLDLGETAGQIAESVDAPFRVRVALFAALMTESSMGTASPGNVLQALEPYTKVRPAEEEISGFLTGDPEWTGVTAIGYAKAHPGKTFYQIAQAVQKSGAGEGSDGASNYGKFGDEAREWAEAFDGEGGSGAIDVTEPYVFEVGKDEDYWTAIKRLAKEVNWRAFFVAGRFFFISEDELFRSQVRLAIDRDTPGVESVDFDFNLNKPITEVTVTAFAGQWAVPPGSVATLAGYGPASIGFGDAPVKADSKGQKRGVSQAREAKTGEGRGRYLVSSIEAPLKDTDDGATRLVTIKLRKPTAPLPEPANERSSSDSSSGAGNATVQRVLDFCVREAEKGTPYVWGGFSENGYDCSGFVSKALNVGGWLDGRLTTSGLANWGEAGEGEFVTVHDKNGTGDPHTEHVIIEVEGRFFECGGGSGGCGELHPSATDLAGFSTKRHPKGF